MKKNGLIEGIDDIEKKLKYQYQLCKKTVKTLLKNFHSNLDWNKKSRNACSGVISLEFYLKCAACRRVCTVFFLNQFGVQKCLIKETGRRDTS